MVGPVHNGLFGAGVRLLNESAELMLDAANKSTHPDFWADALITAKVAKHTHSIGVALVRTADEMYASTLDILA